MAEISPVHWIGSCWKRYDAGDYNLVQEIAKGDETQLLLDELLEYAHRFKQTNGEDAEYPAQLLRELRMCSVAACGLITPVVLWYIDCFADGDSPVDLPEPIKREIMFALTFWEFSCANTPRGTPKPLIAFGEDELVNIRKRWLDREDCPPDVKTALSFIVQKALYAHRKMAPREDRRDEKELVLDTK